MNEHFPEEQKHLDHILLDYERKVLSCFLPLVPPWISTVHLTMMTLLWSAGVVSFGYLTIIDIRWLWAFSVFIFLQHITDMLDGEVGRKRRTGLIKWGFYADHFLDYIFMCSVVVGYSFLLPPDYLYMVILYLIITGGFMVHVFLDFAITRDFKISFNRIGVSEIRYLLIVLNIATVFLGKEFFIKVFPFIVWIAFILLIAIVYISQALYHRLDQDRLGPPENK